MRISPPWIIALALTTTGGAISGASIGTAPIPKRGLDIPAHDASATGPDMTHRAAPTALPDHYALETPEGRVEVGELALRGRLHDTGAARYWTEDRNASASVEAMRKASLTQRERAYFGHDRGADSYPAGHRPAHYPEPERVYEVSEPALSRAEAPLALAEPAPITAAPSAPVSVNIGKARMIDVSASLASRD